MKITLATLIILISFKLICADNTTKNSNKSLLSISKKDNNDSLNEISLRNHQSEINVPQIVIQNNIPETQTDYLSAIISIISLILGFVLNKWYDNYINKKKLKEIGTQWVEHFIQLKEPLKKQIEKLTEYIPLNDENHFEITDPYFNIRLDCNEFSLFDSKGLIHHLNNGKNKLDYKNSVVFAGQIKDVIKLIEHNSKYYKDQIKIMTNEISSQITLINPLLNEFKILVVQYWDYANVEYTEEDQRMKEAKKINHLMIDHILPNLESGEFDLFKLTDDFIKPFFIATYVDRDNSRIENINRLLNSIDMNIKKIKMEKKYFRMNLEKILNNYQEQLNSVSDILLNPIFSNQ